MLVIFVSNVKHSDTHNALPIFSPARNFCIFFEDANKCENFQHTNYWRFTVTLKVLWGIAEMNNLDVWQTDSQLDEQGKRAGLTDKQMDQPADSNIYKL